MDTGVHISLDGLGNERVSQIKVFGVTMLDQINWKSHIKHLQTKL